MSPSVKLLTLAACLALRVFSSAAEPRGAELANVFFDRSYYTTENEARAIARLNGLKGKVPFKARLEIQGGDGKAISGETSVYDPARIVVVVPLRDISLGISPARLLIEDLKGNAIAQQRLDLRRYPPTRPPIREVKADCDRLIALVDGQPFFPLGIYGVPPSQMKMVKEAGFNCTIFWGGQGGAGWKTGPTTPAEGRLLLRRYLDAAQEAGLMVIEWPPNYAKEVLSYVDPGLREKMDSFLKIRLPQVIRAQRDHPALLAYYSLDEPSGDYLREAVAAESRITRELDPYHPNYVLFCVGIQEWPESIDIAGLDWYPRFGQERVIKCLEGAQQAVRVARRLRVPTWHVPLCERSSGSVRTIRGEEQRAQTYLSLIGGVNGIIWWVWPPRYQENWNVLKQLAREINVMMPALTTAIPDQSVVHEPRELEDSVQGSVRVAEGKVYIITCNASAIPAQATFHMGAALSGRADVLFENRQVNVHRGTFRDRFAAYATHVYVLNGTWASGGTVHITVSLEKQQAPGKELESPVGPTHHNLIVDGGFEGEGYWLLETGEKSPNGVRGMLTGNTSHAGKRCAVIERRQEKGRATWTGWSVKLAPYRRYLFGCYGRAELSGGAEAGLFLQGPHPGGDYVRGATTIHFRDRSPAWDRYLVTFCTRDQPLVVRPYLFMADGCGTVWFDDVFLVGSSELAASPNLLRNSSFEEDELPLWPKSWGTSTVLPGMVGPTNPLWGPDNHIAHHGKRSLRMIQPDPWTEDTYGQGSNLNAMQGGLHWQAGHPYTLSAFLKADRPKTQVWWLIGEHLKQLEVGTEWKRYTFTLTPKTTTDTGLVHISMHSAGTLWVDAVQFEAADKASPYGEAKWFPYRGKRMEP